MSGDRRVHRGSSAWLWLLVACCVACVVPVAAWGWCDCTGTPQGCTLEWRLLSVDGQPPSKPGCDTPQETLLELPQITCEGPQFLRYVENGNEVPYWVLKLKIRRTLTGEEIIRCYRRPYSGGQNGEYTGYEDKTSGILAPPGPITYTSGAALPYIWQAGNGHRVAFDDQYHVKSIQDRAGDYVWKDASWSGGLLETVTVGGLLYKQFYDVSEVVSYIEVWRNTELIRTIYFEPTDSGPDRVRVRVTEEAPNSDGSANLETTLYGYYDSGQGTKSGMPKFVLGPAEVVNYLRNAGGTARWSQGVLKETPGAACGLDTTATDDGLDDYAADLYTDYDANGLLSAWTSQCGGCGGGGAGSYSCVYQANGAYPAEPTTEELYNEWYSSHQVTQPGGSRRVEFLNKFNQTVASVEQEMSGETVVNRWITDYKLDTSGRVVEERSPSACVVYTPTTAAGWTTDIGATDTGTVGLVRLRDYDDDDNLLWTKVRQGVTDNDSIEYYQGKTTYASVTWEDVTVWRVKTEARYPSETTDPEAADREVTTYNYTYYQEGGVDTTAVEYEEVVYPVVTTDRNGSGQANRMTRHFLQDMDGEVYYNDWTMHEDGTLSYAQQNDFGQTVKTITDVDTDQAGEFTGLPSGWSHPGGLNLIGTMSYDPDSGRLVSSTDPGGRRTGYAYTVQQQEEAVGEDTALTITAEVTLTAGHVDDQGYFGYAPLSISISDPNGRPLQSATGGPATTSGAIEANWDPDQTQIQSAFDGTLYSWSVSNYNTQGQLTAGDAYFLIPASGFGAEGTNYYRTSYTYNAATGWRQSVTGATGSIAWTQYDQLGRAYASWIGTDDTDADNDDPGNGGAGGNNMKRVSQSFFDESTPGSGTSGVGDGHVTSRRSYYDASDGGKYVLSIYRIDYRGRTRGFEPEAAPYSVTDVDNMGRIIASARYQANVTWTGANSVLEDADYAATVASDPTTGAKRGSLSVTLYDQMGRTYRNESYAVAPATGAAGDKLTSDSYYDQRGRLAGSTSPGNGGTELAYDGAGRQIETRQVTALKDDKYEGGAYAYRLPLPGATSGGNDGVIEIDRTVYDDGSNVIGSVTLRVNHNDNDGIDLTAGKEDFVQSASYMWQDEVYRPIGSAYYGSGDADNQWKYAPLPARAAAPPAASGPGVLVTRTAWADSGRVDYTTDAKGHVSKPFFDDLGRTTARVDNYKAGSTYWTSEPLAPKARAADVNRIVAFTWDGASNQLTQTAVDPNHDGSTADNQVTTWTYGFTYSPSLATKVEYPDSVDSTWDVVSLVYALDGQTVTRTAQKAQAGDTANVVTFTYDDTLRRLVKQAVTMAGTGVDTSVLAIGNSFDSLGRAEKLTSYDDASAENPANVVNQVQYAFDDAGMLYREYQAHDGEVDTASTPYVQYNRDASATGGVYSKGLRLTEVRYPNGRLAHYGYGAAGSRDDMISRVASVNDDQQASGGGTPGLPGAVLSSYAYAGTGMIVQETYPGPGVRLDYAGATSGTYAGFDRFARVKDQRWEKTATGADLDRFAYGYDSNSNRTWRANKGKGTGLDWAYSNDELDRLTDADRGTLKANPDQGLLTTGYKQNWTLDQAGNWPTFQWDPTGSAGWTTQNRTHNKANEITAITDGATADWVDPTYDSRGNMTSGPKPGAETTRIHMVWDAWNRPVKVQDDDGGGSPGATIAEYQYNGANRRIVKLVPNGANWDRSDYYYNASWQVLEVRYDAALADKTTVATTVHEQYVWSLRYIDAPVLRDRDTVAGGDLGKAASGLDERLYYTNDANMSVTALLDVNGAVVERYDYTPYGVVTIYDGTWTDTRAASLYDNEVLYCGYRRDPETGLYQVRNRYYHDSLGRWVSRDPAGYVDGVGLYQYVSGRPTSHLDWAGLYRQYVRGCCTEAQMETIKEDEKLAIRIMERLLHDIQEALDRDKGDYPLWTGSRLARAKQAIKHSIRMTGPAGLKIRCELDDSVACRGADKANAAWVRGIFAFTLHICRDAYFGVPKLRDERERAITHVHELLHTFGLVHGERWLNPIAEPPRSTFLVGYWDNVYTYEYWAKWGFCIPGATAEQGGCGKKSRLYYEQYFQRTFFPESTQPINDTGTRIPEDSSGS